MSSPQRTYGIAELATRGGVSRRTIRYYVRRGLLPAPTGTGRGNHYTDEHVDALIRIRELQESGVTLAEIQQRLQRERHDTAHNPAPPGPPDHPRRPPAVPATEQWTRIVVKRGIELHISARHQLDRAHIARMTDALRASLPTGAGAQPFDHQLREDHDER